MKIKDSEFENNSTINSNRNKISSSDFNKNNIFNNNEITNNNTNLKNSIYDLDKNISVDENISKIQKNYVDYYSKNLNDLEKYKYYNEILNSINFENKEPEIKDIIQIDRLFRINSDENPNMNTTILNDSVN